jgi:hypothetical protein
MKILENNSNVTTFTELKTGDVFKSLMTQEVFMKLSSTNALEVTCDECDNEFECHLDDYAVNLETGGIESFSMFERVEKYNATLTLNR